MGPLENFASDAVEDGRIMHHAKKHLISNKPDLRDFQTWLRWWRKTVTVIKNLALAIAALYITNKIYKYNGFEKTIIFISTIILVSINLKGRKE